MFFSVLLWWPLLHYHLSGIEQILLQNLKRVTLAKIVLTYSVIGEQHKLTCELLKLNIISPKTTGIPTKSLVYIWIVNQHRLQFHIWQQSVTAVERKHYSVRRMLTEVLKIVETVNIQPSVFLNVPKFQEIGDTRYQVK